MDSAIEALRKGTSSIKDLWCIMQDRLSRRVVHGNKPGQKRYLEEALAEHLIEVLKICYGKTRREVKGIIEKVAMEKNLLRKECVTYGWWRRFLERQPKSSLRRGDATAHMRMDSTQLMRTMIYWKKLYKGTQLVPSPRSDL